MLTLDQALMPGSESILVEKLIAEKTPMLN